MKCTRLTTVWGATLKNLRKSAGLSKEALAKRVSSTPEMIRILESGDLADPIRGYEDLQKWTNRCLVAMDWKFYQFYNILSQNVDMLDKERDIGVRARHPSLPLPAGEKLATYDEVYQGISEYRRYVLPCRLEGHEPKRHSK